MFRMSTTIGRMQTRNKPYNEKRLSQQMRQPLFFRSIKLRQCRDRIVLYFASLSVSEAMTSSSFVGMSHTSTLDSGVESLTMLG